MKNTLNFLLEVNKLKETPRTGWVLYGVKNPETIAEHTFRMVILAWLLAEKKNLNIQKIIKTAFSHDLCEVYAGDITPFFYYISLPRNKIDRKKMLLKWIRLSKSEKEKRGKRKFELEKNSLLKLIKNLKPELKREIFSFWVDFTNGISKEGKFVRQVDRIETLIQSIEYFGPNEKKSGTGWWEGTEELIDDPLLLEFLKVIQKKFYNGETDISSKARYGKVAGTYKKQKDLENILDFILKIGKLKKIPRLYWLLREVKNPETVAGHIFTLALMTWIFSKEKPQLNSEKLIKMAFCHEISAVYTGDTTPYDEILPRDKKKRKEIFQKWPRLPKKEKMKIFLKDFQEEKIAIEKLTLKLNPILKKEIIQLWEEYRTKSTPEGHFLSQLNVLAVLFQALLYEKKNKNFSSAPLWEWAFEVCDNPLTAVFLDEMKKKFYKYD